MIYNQKGFQNIKNKIQDEIKIENGMKHMQILRMQKEHTEFPLTDGETKQNHFHLVRNEKGKENHSHSTMEKKEKRFLCEG